MLRKMDKNIRLMLLPCDPRAWFSGLVGMIDLAALIIKTGTFLNFVICGIGLLFYTAYFGMTVWFWVTFFGVSCGMDVFVCVLIYLIAWFAGTVGGAVCTLWADNGGKKVEL